MPHSPPSPLTVAQAAAWVDGLSDLPAPRQRLWRRALLDVAVLAGTPPEATPLDPIGSVALLDAATARQLDISDATLANRRSGLRGLLRRLELLETPAPPPASVVEAGSRVDAQEAWAPLLALLPEGPEFGRLRVFVRDCAALGLGPAQVGPETLRAFTERRVAAEGGTRAIDRARRISGLWRKAEREIAGWPKVVFVAVREVQRSPQLAEYPAPLADEVERYLTLIARAPEGETVDAARLFDDEAPPSVRETTVEQRRSGVRRLLWGAREAGIPLDRLSHLSALAEPDIAKAALTWHFQRKGGAMTSDMASFAATIMSVATYLRVGAERHAALKALVSRIKRPPPQGLTARNRKILAYLENADARQLLLALPATLMAKAETQREGGTGPRGTPRSPRPVEAAWTASVAVAIDLTMYTALRIGELSALRLGDEVELLAGDARRPRAMVRTNAARNKTGATRDIPLEGQVVKRLRRYLDVHRPALPHAETKWLFPGRESADQPRHKLSLSQAITDAIHQHVGIRMNPHAFRCFAAALVLEANPHALDDVRAILGHASFETALAFYRHAEAAGAARRLAGVLEGQSRRPRSHGSPSLPLALSSGLRRGRPR